MTTILIAEDDQQIRQALERILKFEGYSTVAVNDGAAALVLANEKAVKERGLKPIARLVNYGGHAQEPEWFTTAPVGATRKALERAGMKASDINYWEVNEAFAVVAMAARKDLEIPDERLNIHGSGCSIGHPIGATGSRIVVTLLHVLQEKEASKGLATLCIGGGEGLATIWERV